MSEKSCETLVREIIDLELAMFLAVKNRGGTSLCQEHPDSFRLMREITHAVLPLSFLESYLNDLKQGVQDARNFMSEKYALMESLIPPLNTDPCIDAIVDAESAWRAEVAAEFPKTVQPEGREGFRLYLGCELQTYSPATLAEYTRFVDAAHAENRNPVRERYELLMRKLGYGSLKECEASRVVR
ncbi:DUF4125 family protein [Pseudodesulfovibrio tunisiensis]|uniref:DUF4125 family protein n=1 Tax=Pseudodesulfovibrio tunisiensis TaxID=463192 RepID=UPI001FB1E072|nr:DUF4125 family protein [Pseudodesulfovibrio tunisiensis]